MPRPVVPMADLPLAASRRRSSSMCQGMMTWARSLIFRRSRMLSPLASSPAISSRRRPGWMTTPLPMRPSVPGRTRPVGTSESL